MVATYASGKAHLQAVKTLEVLACWNGNLGARLANAMVQVKVLQLYPMNPATAERINMLIGGVFSEGADRTDRQFFEEAMKSLKGKQGARRITMAKNIVEICLQTIETTNQIILPLDVTEVTAQ